MKPNATRADRLMVFGKYPYGRAVKTRLVPPLCADEAADLYRAFLIDALESWPSCGPFDTRLYITEASEVEAMEHLLAEEIDGATPIAIRAQSGAALGTRLLRAFEESFDDGCRRVCAIGSDHPTLPTRLIAAAFDPTPEADVVIGPTDDGGYWLIGMDAPHPELFDRMPYSTDALFGATLARARELGLRVRELDRWYDVDDGADLARLESDRDRLADGSRTLRMLTALSGSIAGREEA